MTNPNTNEEPLTKRSRPSPSKAGAAEALRRVAEGGGVIDDSGFVRKRTEVEEQVISHEQEAENIVDALPSDENVIPKVDLFLPEILKDAVFVGHLVTDLDSVAGAIGAAALYGGVPALASEVNSETQFALEYWGVTKPRRIEEVLKETPNADVCLVDHQQTSQMNPSIKSDQVVGIIDHHALQNKTIVTAKPVYIDIRPWGSMSSIIAHTFLTHSRRPPKSVAGMLLCAILSDTLNLQGPTTTEWDRLMVAVLAEISGVSDIQLLAQQQFKAKSKELEHLSAHALVNGDQKAFAFDASGFTGEIGFAVVETTDDDIILQKASKLIPEMVACKREKNLSMIFLAVVNIVKLKSCLLLCGPSEKALAVDAFGGEISRHDTLMDLGNRVSRKKEFIPVITKVINDGWKRPKNLDRGLSDIGLDKLGHLEVDPNDPYGNVERIGSLLDDDSYDLNDEEEKKEESNAKKVVG
mmetsp:Transcript_11321/g.21192  ORF Transcript_11321/g.21192 Transcript_11321/m.21192 type:complete len:468 (-) Transcript_11321:99-1502(-)